MTSTASRSTANQPVVYVVEDDGDIRKLLRWILQAGGYQVEVYGRGLDLLANCDPQASGCFVLDLHLPDIHGIELLAQLEALGCRQPFIIVSGEADVSEAVETMRRGAVDFLQKPFDRKVLLERVATALDRDREYRRVEERIDSLSDREREVLAFVERGALTKQIARELGISPKTVDVHRSHIMKKLRVESAVELARLVALHARTRSHLANA